MIVITSNAPRERLALAALCESQGWSSIECDSVRAFVRTIHRAAPTIALVRHKLDDGYSDDVIASLAALHLLLSTKVIVLVGAGTPSSTEVRQLTLGADCVLRDPVRTDVLTAYIAKYIGASRPLRADTARAPTKTVRFCGTILCAVERTLCHGDQTVLLTPKEVALVELLAHSRGDVVTYDTLYGEILGRRFRGDTSNMRVLLGKLGASTRSVGVALRRWVDVIPKTGYRYKCPAPDAPQDTPCRN